MHVIRYNLCDGFDLLQIEALDDVVRQSLVDQLQQKQIKLDVFGVADTGAVANAHEDKASVAMRATNTSTVHELLAEVSGTYRCVVQSSTTDVFCIKHAMHAPSMCQATYSLCASVVCAIQLDMHCTPDNMLLTMGHFNLLLTVRLNTYRHVMVQMYISAIRVIIQCFKPAWPPCRALPDVPDMYGMFKAKEVSSTTMFKGPLTIGKHMEIQVGTCKGYSSPSSPHDA